MVQKLDYNPNTAIHPGFTLEETLEFLGMSQKDLAERTGLTEKHISQIINGKASITPATAIKLERVLGVKAEGWINLERNYRITLARLEAERTQAEEEAYAKQFTCYNELVALGAVAKVAVRDYKAKAENLMRYFRVDSLSYVQRVHDMAYTGYAFRNMKHDVNHESLAAWLRLGEIEAEKITVGEFSIAGIKMALKEARALTTQPNGFEKRLQELFAVHGVAIVYAPYFKNTKINGATRWVGEKAVVQLNTKGTFGDIFWFTFFHEIGHLVLHGKKAKFLDFESSSTDVKEREADDFAVSQLIPPDMYDLLMRKERITVAEAQGFCEEIGIDFGILAGRLAHEHKLPWPSANKFRKKIEICQTT